MSFNKMPRERQYETIGLMQVSTYPGSRTALFGGPFRVQSAKNSDGQEIFFLEVKKDMLNTTLGELVEANAKFKGKSQGNEEQVQAPKKTNRFG